MHPTTRLNFGAVGALPMISNMHDGDGKLPGVDRGDGPPDEAPQRDRRGYPRTGLELQVHITVVASDGPGDDLEVRGATVDVSRGGCSIVVDRALGDDGRCIVRFPPGDDRVAPDTVEARICGSRRLDDGFLLNLEFDEPLESLRIAAGAAPLANDAAAGRTVLIVDDQTGIRGVLERHLRSHGFTVHTAGDGESAFSAILRQPPDVLLVDLYLPRLNGHDLLRRLREAGIEIELIFTMSGYADTSDAQECLRLGATDHLLKPLDVGNVYRSIMLRLGAGSS